MFLNIWIVNNILYMSYQLNNFISLILGSIRKWKSYPTVGLSDSFREFSAVLSTLYKHEHNKQFWSLNAFKADWIAKNNQKYGMHNIDKQKLF